MAEPTGDRSLDLITVGRSSVDLYGEQIGGRLEDMGSFAKYVGGSPTNTAIGAARLGLRAGLLTRVGNDHFGRFIREELARWGWTSPASSPIRERLTALAVLGIRDERAFPLLFYRENCADMALCEATSIRPSSAAPAPCSSTAHICRQPGVRAASRKAAELARAAGGAGRVRHRLSAGAVGIDRAGCRRESLRRQTPPSPTAAGNRAASAT